MKSTKITSRDLRIFGFIWGLIFTITSYKSEKFFIASSSLSALFFLSAALCPKIYLRIRFYQNWIKVGDVLGRVNGFLISFILFYGIFAPVGIALRLLKKDLLSKKMNRLSNSYFIDRKSQPGDMRNQF